MTSPSRRVRFFNSLHRTILLGGLLLMAGSANAATYTLKITFRGLVDLISNGAEEPSEAWILIPDMANPAGLPLKEKVDITAHRAVLLVEGSLSPPTYTSCHDGTVRHAVDIRGQHVTIGVTSSSSKLFINRALRDGAKPVTTMSSIEWLAGMDLLSMVSSINGKPVGLRTDLLDLSYAGGLLASRLYLDRGTITTNSFVLNDVGLDHLPVPLPGLARSMGHTFQLVLTVDGPTILRLRPLSDSTVVAKEHSLSPPSGSTELHLIVENEVAQVSGTCLTEGDRDFAGHYVLRQGSEMLVPFIPEGIDAGPGSNPQCSPGDNTWP